MLFACVTYYVGRIITRPLFALDKARQSAESATKAKSDFLANMSHEIRTPLNGAMGMMALLLGTKMNVQQREWAQIAYQSSEELLNLINDILDISKVEAGQMTLENLPFDLQTNIKDVTDLLYPRASRKGVEILVAFQSDLPRMVVGDPVRLRQILLNLVGNAVKFTSEGSITISVEGESRADRLFLKFEVKDTGMGIPEDKLNYVFEKFSQAEESTTRNFGGTGLGLTICRKLTALMGGEVGVRSVLGQGSTFWFTLLLNKSKSSLSVVPASQQADDMVRLLVSEPNEPVLHLIAGYLSQWGHRVETFASDVGATTLLQQSLALDDPFRFLLIEADGWGSDPAALSGRIDTLHNAAPDTRLILIASPDKPLPMDEITLQRSVGVLTKPIFPQDLYDVLSLLGAIHDTASQPRFIMARGEHRGLTATDPVETNSAKEAGPKKKTILIAEDQLVNQMLMRTIIKQYGCVPELASNGLEAVKMAAEKRYDLIFMDGHMPEMDGLEATKQIRAFEQRLNLHTPIIAVTADAMKGDRDKCIGAGMDDYLYKPVKAESIKAMIEKYTGTV
ncbi:MAG TPA: hypothetical protein DCY07_04045 [Rhodospirillaceae bacterium]|nr:hypothetical protein [Rhodospirillaceae bacterium]